MLVFIVVVTLVLGFALKFQKLAHFVLLAVAVFFFLQPAAFLTLLVCGLAVYWGYQHFQSKRKPRYVSKRRY